MKAAPLLTLVLSTLLPLSTSAQGRFDNIEIKITHVAGSVHLLEGAGGNIGVSVGEDGVLIIDSQFAPLSGKIEAAIKKLGKGRPRYLLNTHWHGDHTGGNDHFGRYAEIIAHANVRKRLAAKSGAVVKSGLPVITFREGLTLHFNGDEIQMVALAPGHTDGDSLIVFKQANVIHLGDQFFSGRFPFIDVSSGGDPRGYLRNVETAIQTAPAGVKIIPGHGPLSTVKELETFRDTVKSSIELVGKGIAAGRTKEQIKGDDFWKRYADWGAGFINTSRWVDILHGSLGGK